MMSSSSALLAVSLVLSFIANSHQAQLKCYNCVEMPPGTNLNQLNLPSYIRLPSADCGTYSGSVDQLATCSGTNAACYSYTVRVDATGSDKLTARVKTCSAQKATADQCTAIQGKSISAELECDRCTEDKCNSATSSTASLLLIVSPALLYKLLR